MIVENCTFARLVLQDRMGSDFPDIHNIAHRTAPRGAVYCGRGSPYGNPYVIGPDGGRDEVIRKYEEHVLPTLDVEPLRGKHLVCHCRPKRCHCDSIFMKLYGRVPSYFVNEQ